MRFSVNLNIKKTLVIFFFSLELKHLKLKAKFGAAFSYQIPWNMLVWNDLIFPQRPLIFLFINILFDLYQSSYFYTAPLLPGTKLLLSLFCTLKKVLQKVLMCPWPSVNSLTKINLWSPGAQNWISEHSFEGTK